MATGAAARPNDDMGPRRFTSRSKVCDTCTRAPFAWQDGRRLWMLDCRESDCVLAELLFEPLTCRYVEVRRSIYRWPREAAGALLGRSFAGGELRAQEAARGLSDWASRVERTI